MTVGDARNQRAGCSITLKVTVGVESETCGSGKGLAIDLENTVSADRDNWIRVDDNFEVRAV